MQIGVRFRCYTTHAQAQGLLRGIGARRAQGSGWVKAGRGVGRHQRTGVDMRRGMACQINHTPALDRCCTLYVSGALKIPTRTTKPGLDKAVLVSVRGQTRTCLQYKARRRGKLVIAVPSPYSSQECAACGHIHPDSRVSHCGFVCQRCDHAVHADHDSAEVLAWRGVRATLAGRWAPQESKWWWIIRVQVGAEGSEPRAAAGSSTLGEITVRGGAGNTSAHGS